MRAFHTFFDRWYPRLVRHLRARLADADHAEDIAQEAFVRLLDESPRDPVAWLFTVASHLAIDDGRVAAGRARRLELVRRDDRDADPGPESRLLAAEERARVRRALDRLAERDRLLLLAFADGWRYREMARALGVASSSVGPLLTRAQRRLAAALDAPEESSRVRPA